jgi:hypothetical protein
MVGEAPQPTRSPRGERDDRDTTIRRWRRPGPLWCSGGKERRWRRTPCRDGWSMASGQATLFGSVRELLAFMADTAGSELGAPRTRGRIERR